MYIYKFNDGDLLNNTIEANPECTFYVYGRTLVHNNSPAISGAFTDPVKHVPRGYVSLYEMNVDRSAGNLIYPFITKDGSQGAFNTITTTSFNQFSYGDTLTGSYPLSASISKEYWGPVTDTYARTSGSNHITSLENTLNYYRYLSPHYAFSSSVGTELHWNKATQQLGLVSIPSIFYGSSIKKGSMSLKFFISGTLVGELHDAGKNGELIQVGPTGSNGSGSVAGVVLYNEGFCVLTGTWDLTANSTAMGPAHTEAYVGAASSPNWTYFANGVGTFGGTNTQADVAASSSFYMKFDGTQHVPTITMFANAPRNHLIHSNNRTYQNSTQSLGVVTSSAGYYEGQRLAIKNIASSSFAGYEQPYEKITYISRVGIYDEDKNLIGVAKLANPVKKTASREFTFKLKLDI
tara:strand:+ start:338 stop:1558 length:1221 start_codon:yes stop_codon:yes gene_type:complete